MRARDADFYRLKAATADLVERCGGQARAGSLIGRRQQAMSELVHRDHDAAPTILEVVALERDAGAAVITAVAAELAGYRLERERPPEPEAGCAHSAHAAVMSEVADLCMAFGRAVADGRYSCTDAATVERELADLRRAIERFERVNAAARAGPS